MKVLVTGAGGFLGRHVVDRLLKGGHRVRAMVRPASTVPPWPATVELFHADLRVCDDLVPAFGSIDAVIHLAAATSGDEDSQFASSVVATERFLLAMAKTPVKRLVHVSSIAVYDWSRIKRVMDEDSPLLADIYGMGGYTIAKSWQERVVRAFAAGNSWELSVLRPGFIWGTGHALIAGMGRRVGRTYVMVGPLTRLPLTHVVNCADCIVTALENKAASGETFNVVDNDDIRVWRYVREYARGTGERGFFVPLPYSVGHTVAAVASLISRALFGKKGRLPSLLVPQRFESQFKPVRFSNSRLKERLNWRPPLDFSACLRLTYK